MFNFLNNKKRSFWEYFAQNEEKIFNLKSGDARLVNEITNELKKEDKNLQFELGGFPDSSVKEFVISANAVKESFDTVRKLISEAPESKRFKFIAFKQPKEDIENAQIKYEGVHNFLIKDFGFLYSVNGNMMDVTVVFPSGAKNPNNGLGLIVVDSILGELTSSTALSKIDSKCFDSLDEEVKKIVLPIMNMGEVIKNELSPSKI